MRRSVILWLFVFFGLGFENAYGQKPPFFRIFETPEQIAKHVADEIIQLAHQNPRALMVLPTGASPLPAYQHLLKRFSEEPSIDFSQVTIFFWDEYASLEEHHPLRYSFYRDFYLMNELQRLDAARAPDFSRVFIPFDPRRTTNRGITPEERQQEATTYERLFQNARKESQFGRVDLFVLGAGGAYPVTDDHGRTTLSGGHMGFNEPADQWMISSTHVARLSEKTRKDTAFRFRSVAKLVESGELPQGLSAEVPAFAVTLGLQNFLEDATAADHPARVITIMTGEAKGPIAKTVIEEPETHRFPVSLIQRASNSIIYLDREAASLLKTQKEQIEAHRVSKDQIEVFENYFSTHPPRRVLIISPHPDDDVISMGMAIKKLLELGHEVHVLTMTSGANAVRKKDGGSTEALATLIRQTESQLALELLGLPAHHVHFLNLDFYWRRGIPGVRAFSSNDHKRVTQFLKSYQPTDIFVAAENDPHGAHGLSTTIVELSLQQQKLEHPIQVWGYRGAYAEWAFDRQGLLVLAFSEDEMALKIQAILQHRSQLNPLFPSFDQREFWQRAQERNLDSGKQWQRYEAAAPPCAEVFRRLKTVE